MKKYALIVAGGVGSRMHATLAKQFIELAGKPILMHAIQAFLSYDPEIILIVVLHESLETQWQKLCKKHRFHHHHQVISGGPTRFHSVKNGLRHVADDALVAVHDGVRPLVSKETIARVFLFAGKFGNAIPVAAPADSVRLVEGAISTPLSREAVRLVQTPQCFVAGRLKKAFNRSYLVSFTDEASVLEVDGERLYFVEGNHENIKVTHPSDLVFAEAILSNKKLLEEIRSSG